MGATSRKCERCEQWFIPCGNPNETGRSGSGVIVPNEGPVCYPCMDEPTKTR